MQYPVVPLGPNFSNMSNIFKMKNLLPVGKSLNFHVGQGFIIILPNQGDLEHSLHIWLIETRE